MATKAQIAKRFKDGGHYSPIKASRLEIRWVEALLQQMYTTCSDNYRGEAVLIFESAREQAKSELSGNGGIFKNAVNSTIYALKHYQKGFTKGIRSKSAGLRRTSREGMYSLGRQIQYLQDTYLKDQSVEKINAIIKKEAQALYNTFYEPIPRRVMHFVDHNKLAKDLALIHIDELISKGYNLTDIPNKALNEIMNGTEYYLKLKQAIQNL